MDARIEGRKEIASSATAEDNKNAEMTAVPRTVGKRQTGKAPHRSNRRGKRTGLTFPRYFTRAGRDPFDEVQWERRDASIKGADGKVYFEQKDVEFPAAWSQTATNVVVQKYFRGTLGTPEREASVKQMLGRVADTIYGWGKEDGYFKSRRGRAGVPRRAGPPAAPPEDGVQLAGLVQRRRRGAPAVLGLLHQLGRRLDGVDPRPGQDRGHAVQVRLRHRLQPVEPAQLAPSCSTAAAPPSGPVSFMKGFDAFAGVIKSGGKTRRAAKMVILNAEHPDIVDFVDCKASEEKKAWALIDAGYDGGFNVVGGAYDSVFYQNANHSVRVTDEFMHAVAGRRRLAHPRGGRRPAWSPACARATSCARSPRPPTCAATPGMQFDTTINDWHPCINTARINASNPCSEYMFLDDSACNLASLNLRKFQQGRRRASTSRPTATRSHAPSPRWRSSSTTPKYPTDAIARELARCPPAGPGLRQPRRAADVARPALRQRAGPRLRRRGHRVLCGEAYRQSAAIAGDATGPFEGYERQPRAVPRSCASTAPRSIDIDAALVPYDLIEAARESLGPGHRARRGARLSATARPPCSRPPAPSAS